MSVIDTIVDMLHPPLAATRWRRRLVSSTPTDSRTLRQSWSDTPPSGSLLHRALWPVAKGDDDVIARRSA